MIQLFLFLSVTCITLGAISSQALKPETKQAPSGSLSTTAQKKEHILPLEKFLNLVQEQSLDLKIEKAKTEQTQAQASGMRIPSLMVSMLKMQDSGGENQGYELSQELPFPSKIYKDYELRKWELKNQEALFMQNKNKILAEARQAYMEFWKAYSLLGIKTERRNWFETHLKLSRAIARSDSAAQSHLLEIESQADRFENEVWAAESQFLTSKINLQVNAPELSLDSILPQEPEIKSLPNTNSKTLSVAQKEIELQSIEALKSVKKLSYLPDFYLKYRLYQGNTMNPKNEELMIGLSLPFLYFWQPSAEHQKATAQLFMMEQELKKSKIQAEQTIQNGTQKLESLHRQLKLLRTTLLPRAQKRVKLVNNFSNRTMESFDAHRMVMLDYYELKFNEVDLRFEYESAWNDLFEILDLEK